MTEDFSRLFLRRARHQAVGEPLDVVARLREGTPVSEQESRRFFDWLIYATREQLGHAVNRALNADGANGTPRKALDVSKDTMEGHCSFSQNIVAYALLDRGLDAKQFSMQSMKGCTVGHAVVSLTIAETDGRATYVIEPTYPQLCDANEPFFEGKLLPGFVLAKMDGGRPLARKLMRDGYLKMTPKRAYKYLASFTSGVSVFDGPKEAMTYIQNPPYDDGRRFFSRASMERAQALIGCKSTPA